MSAFNWIDFEDICPACGQKAQIRAQTHMASDYDGDAGGRFHDESYQFGQTMRWWNVDHASYKDWKNGNRANQLKVPDTVEHECCYATCLLCDANLFAVLEFHECVPLRSTKLGKESDWPDEYLK